MMPARALRGETEGAAKHLLNLPPVKIADDDPRLATQETACAAYHSLRSRWWAAYKTLGMIDEARQLHAEVQGLKLAAIARFGSNAEHPDCDYCLEVSVFGGPSHDGSQFCRKGESHCTCRLCH